MSLLPINLVELYQKDIEISPIIEDMDFTRVRAILDWEEKISPSQYATKHYVLEGSSAVGEVKFTFDKAPHLRTPLDVFISNAREINYWFASQSGKTTLSMILVNYIIKHDPSNILYYLPTDAVVDFNSTERIIPAIEKTPNKKLIEVIEEDKKRKSKKSLIRFPSIGSDSVALRILGATSQVNLKSTPAKYMFLDESAEFPKQSVVKIKERGKTYDGNGFKFLSFSTSETKKDPIVSGFRTSECQMEYEAKCPVCKKSHIDNFIDNIYFKYKADLSELDNESEEFYDEIRKMSHSARYKCPHCGALWTTSVKNRAMSNGKWKAVKGDINKADSIGFRCSSLVSHFVSIRRMTEEYLKAQTDEEKKDFYNGWLSVIYEPKIQSTPKEKIWNLKGKIPYEIVPDNTIGLVGAVDWQKDHYYGMVVAVDEDMNKHITEYQRIETPHDLEMFILRPRFKQNGDLINVEAWANDSGYNAFAVYDFCYDMNTMDRKIGVDATINRVFEKREGEAVNCIPIKGSSRNTSNHTGDKSSIKTIDKDFDGKPYDDTLKLHVINTYMYKDQAMKLIERSISENRDSQMKNSLYIHADMDDMICEALTSEYKKELPNGHYFYDTVKSHAFNHYFDCLYMCLYQIDKLEIRHRELLSKEVQDEVSRYQEDRVKRRQRRYGNDWANEY